MYCGNPISEARLKALPETETCVRCSDTKKVKGFTVVEHKTGNYVQVVDEETFKELARLDYSKGRARTGYAGAE
jgi:hypothetical protein